MEVRLAVGIEEVLAALLPRRFEFRRCDVPVRPAFHGNGTEILAEIFQGRAAEEPLAIVDLIDDKTRLQDNHVGDHGIVGRVRVFGDVQIFLYEATHVGEKKANEHRPHWLSASRGQVGACGRAVMALEAGITSEIPRLSSRASAVPPIAYPVPRNKEPVM
jgi:hypothetical protein